MPEYHPLWAAAQDLEVPLSLHAGTNRFGSGDAFQFDEAVKTTQLCNFDHYVRMSIAEMLLSGVFELYPRLYVGAVEHELSWAPHFLDRMDFNYTQRARGVTGYRIKNDMLPSDSFPPERVHGLPGGCPRHKTARHHRRGYAPVGVRLSPSRVYLPKES